MTNRSTEPHVGGRFLGNTALVMGAFVLSRVLGLLREAILGGAFSASNEMDAFRAASRVTETLYVLVAGGALGSAFIPTFTTYLARDKRETAWRVASAVVNLVFLVTLIASTVAMLIAPWLVSTVLAPGYDAPTQALTVSLLRWTLFSTLIFGVSGLLMGILNANDHFLTPALAPSLYNLGIIFGATVLAQRWGIHGVAIGTVVGALLHLLIQLPALARLDWRYSPILGLRLDGVREVGRLMGPRVLGLAITQFHFWVNTNLGSRIPVVGVVAALTWGWQLMLLPQGIVGQAIATVAFPAFSAQAARGDRAGLRAAIASVLGFVLFLTLPATVGLILLSRPLVQMLFMRGAFDADAVEMVVWALAWYALGLTAHSGLEIVTRAFYALHDTWTPVWIGGTAMALNILFSVVFSQFFGRFDAGSRPWLGLGGLALANSAATALETLALTWLLRRRLGGLDARWLWNSVWRALAASAVMGLALWGYLAWTPAGSSWLIGSGGIALGAVAFAGSAWLFKSPEVAQVIAVMRQRVAVRT
ncbi:MAG: murein biosynthesis integral membrane protein MurJ [Anaerolineae bacterium]|nr:murein biosynthesis integral membrane protein MurJ [Anaerolineae bacterium]